MTDLGYGPVPPEILLFGGIAAVIGGLYLCSYGIDRINYRTIFMGWLIAAAGTVSFVYWWTGR